jgi:hypothetical protein
VLGQDAAVAGFGALAHKLIIYLSVDLRIPPQWAVSTPSMM